MGRTPGTALSVGTLVDVFARIHRALDERRGIIDALNVFPVPDGDTGTNMTLTMRAGLDGLLAGDADPRDPSDRDRVVSVAVRETLGGARGNSGVILSQVVRALAEAAGGVDALDTRTYAQALERARVLAYDAIAEPVEGTMLTAITAAAEAAHRAAEEDRDLLSASEQVCAATADAVERTPELLEVLRRAGVVDAGARGFEVVLAAIHGHLGGTDRSVAIDRPPAVAAGTVPGCTASEANPYEVQYLLEGGEAEATHLRTALTRLGDSVAVVSAGQLLNVHVHTSDVDAVVAVGCRVGTPEGVRVTELAPSVPGAGGEPGRVAVVAVARGDGMAELVRQEGAVAVQASVDGLVSVEELLAGVRRSGAPTVILLPGHRGAVPAARAVVGLARSELGCDVHVIREATDPPAVLAAVAVVGAGVPRATPEAVATATAAAAEAAAAVRSGEVVAAVRDARTPVGTVRAGQPLAVLADGTVCAAAADDDGALEALADALELDRAELVTVLTGADTRDRQRAEAVDRLRARAPHAELEVIDAGVRPSRYWVGAQ